MFKTTIWFIEEKPLASEEEYAKTNAQQQSAGVSSGVAIETL